MFRRGRQSIFVFFTVAALTYLCLRHNPDTMKYIPGSADVMSGVMNNIPDIPNIMRPLGQYSRQGEAFEFEADIGDVSQLLSPEYAPSTVYYVFCQQEHFTFRHYLAVQSVIQPRLQL